MGEICVGWDDLSGEFAKDEAVRFAGPSSQLAAKKEDCIGVKNSVEIHPYKLYTCICASLPNAAKLRTQMAGRRGGAARLDQLCSPRRC